MKRNQLIINFTLVEILVVIGIIALLAGLLFPVLSKMRGRAKKSACMGNLRQIGVSLNAYVEYNNHQLPSCDRVGATPDDPFCVANVLECGSKKVFQCPKDVTPIFDNLTFFKKHGSSYEWNSWLNGKFIDGSELNFSQMVIHTPIMGDASNFHENGNNYLWADGRVAKSLEVKIE